MALILLQATYNGSPLPTYDPADLRNARIGIGFGVFVLLLAVYWIYSGRVRTRFDGWIYHTQEPKKFWWQVTMYFISALAIIIFFVYKYHAYLSN